MKIETAIYLMRKVFEEFDKDFTVGEYKYEIQCLLNYADGEFIRNLRNEYATQDNRMTAYPILVLVQEQFCIGIIEDGYSVNCHYGDGETKIKYKLSEEDYDAPEFDSKKELIKYYEEETDWGGIKERDIQEYRLGYIWHTVEHFLTVKGAERYIQSNKYNLNNPRTYITHISYKNYEMTKLFEEMGLRTKTA